jgi:adenosine/AMP kinase
MMAVRYHYPLQIDVGNINFIITVEALKELEVLGCPVSEYAIAKLDVSRRATAS